VIQEETESQMSSDSEQELENQLEEYYTNSRSPNKMTSNGQQKAFGLHEFTDSPDIMGIESNLGAGNEDPPNDSEANNSDEIIMKHIRIPPHWDPVSSRYSFYSLACFQLFL